jgi:predicted CopG family antitoxin
MIIALFIVAELYTKLQRIKSENKEFSLASEDYSMVQVNQ